MNDAKIKIGTVCKWLNPVDASESDERFTLIEDNGDRGFVRSIEPMSKGSQFYPQTLVRICEITPAE